MLSEKDKFYNLYQKQNIKHFKENVMFINIIFTTNLVRLLAALKQYLIGKKFVCEIVGRFQSRIINFENLMIISFSLPIIFRMIMIYNKNQFFDTNYIVIHFQRYFIIIVYWYMYTMQWHAYYKRYILNNYIKGFKP